MCRRASLENLGRASSYLKTSVFTRPHEYDEPPFSKISTLESTFEKPPFSVPANAGYVWMVAVFGEKTLRFRKYPATCGQALNVKNVAPGTKQRCLQGFSRAKTQIQDVQVLEMWKFNSRTFKDRPIPAYPRDTVWLVFSTIFTIRTLMVRMIWGPSSNCINLSSNRAEISTWCMIE